MRNFLSALVLVGSLAVPVVGHATNFTFAASGGAGGFNGSGTLITSNVGSTYTITGISGTGITGLIAPNGFNGNDNLLFPNSPTLLDVAGFSFTDVMGNTAFQVNIYGSGTGTYNVFFRDSDNFTQTLPVTFSIATVAATPEPSSLLLLGTGVLGLAGAARRRFARA